MGNASVIRRAQPNRRADNRDNRDNRDNMAAAGPGWYYDPDDEAIYRFWDGHRWTEHRSDHVVSELPTV